MKSAIQLDLTKFSIFSPPANTLDHPRQMPKVILVFARGICPLLSFYMRRLVFHCTRGSG